MIREFEKKLHGKKFVAFCDDALFIHAEWLLETVARINEKSGIKDLEKIQVGWTLFTVIESEDGFSLLQPRYSGNPFEDVEADVTTSLFVLAEQTELHKKLDVDMQFALFHEKVVCQKGCLNKPHIYLERTDASEKGDSGWYIGGADDESLNDENKEYEALYVYQFIELRPELLQVFSLPEGYLVVFKDKEIVSIKSGESEEPL